MAFIRAFENRLNDLFLSGAIAGTTHLCIGQEACALGVCDALLKEDAVFSNHRGHGHLLGKGADPGRLMAEIVGSPKGYSGGRGGSQHIAVSDIHFMGTHGITAGTIPLAVGAALHFKKNKVDRVAVVFFGDGAVAQGVFHESMNMAALWNLPVLFVCENNLYAMSSSHERFSPVADIASRAAAYDMKSTILDGNDYVNVVAEMTEIRQAMSNEPHPVLVELKTFRVSGHSRGDQCVYRTREEEAEWSQLDPIGRVKALLEQDHDWHPDEDAALHDGVSARVASSEAYAFDKEGAS
jgi:acetoin:2,6-dichlorophenolindophenol oxidoreductase subunit alpha